MIVDSEMIRLKEAYRKLQSLEIVLEYGPLRAYAEHNVAQLLWRDTINPAVALVAATSRKTADGTHVAEAPSPWHAYFYLRAEQQDVYRAGRPLGEPATVAGESGPEHLFFRGQRCADWEFKSALRRGDPSTQASERRAVTALDEYFRLQFVANEDVAGNAAHCFAQHYGIATDFMDISCDPDIAVWFATHPTGKACESGEANGAVRALTWAGQQQGSVTRVLLAPPFVRNVYRQRGLFVDTDGTNGKLEGELILDVRFPRETAGGEFEVIRRGSPLDIWPEPDHSEKELVRWARDIGAAYADEDAIRGVVRMTRDEKSFPSFWLDRDLSDVEAQVSDWLSILDWVLPATCVTALPVSGPSPMRYEVLDLKVRALARSNPTFFGALADASEGANFTGFEVLQQVLTIASDELSTQGT